MSPSPRLHYAWITVALAVLVVFASLGLGRFAYAAVLPAMQAGLGFDNTHAGALASVNLIGYLIVAALSGALASQIGPRRVVAAGLTLVGVGLLGTGLARTYGEALVWRFVTGAGSGASNVPAMALLAAWFAPRRRGLAAGIGVAGSSVALILVGPLCPLLLAAGGGAGWRWCWFVFGALALAMAALAAWRLRNRPAELGLLPCGASAGDPPPAAAARDPLARVYGSRRVWELGLVYFLFGFGYIIYMTFFSKRLQADLGFSPRNAGRLFMLLGWVSLVCGVTWGAASDRLGRRVALALVYLIQASSLVLFAFAPRSALVASAVLFGFTAWSAPAIMAAACGDLLGPRLAPAALGFITLFFGVGQALGPAVAGWLGDAHGSFAPGYLVGAVALLAGAAGTLALRESRAA